MVTRCRISSYAVRTISADVPGEGWGFSCFPGPSRRSGHPGANSPAFWEAEKQADKLQKVWKGDLLESQRKKNPEEAFCKDVQNRCPNWEKKKKRKQEGKERTFLSFKQSTGCGRKQIAPLPSCPLPLNLAQILIPLLP